MKKRFYVLVALLLTLSLLLAGCGAESIAGGKEYANNVEMGIVEDDSVTAGEGEEPVSQRKVIVNAYYSIETEDLSKATKDLETLAQQSGGYVEEAYVDDYDADGYAEYVLRIPSDRVDTLSAGLEKLGVIDSHSKSSEDITDQYYDLDARRKAKEAQRDRILALLEQATSLDQLLSLEQELAEVQGELDSLTGAQNRYDQQVAYATVTVELWQSALGQTGDMPFGIHLSREVRKSFSTALEVLQALLVVLVWLLPYLLIAVVVVAIVLLTTRKKRKARKAMRQQLQKTYQAPGSTLSMQSSAPPAPPVPPTDDKK